MKSTLPFVMFAGAALTACQTTPTPSPPDRFAHADADGDGVLNRSEVAKYLSANQFDAADKDHNGELTLAEWNPAGTESATRIFRDADANRDGVVKFPEAGAFALKTNVVTDFFTGADANKDGILTREEVRTYYTYREGLPR
jgi:Ca2+-binding EF-hand superfamily protein